MTRVLLTVCALVVVMSQVGCRKKSSSGTPAVVPTLRELRPDEVAAAETFGRKLERMFTENKTEDLVGMFDEEAFRVRVFAGADIREASQRDFVKGAMGQIFKSLGSQGGEAKFLRAGNLRGRPVCLIRVLMASGGSNYLEFLINPQDAPDFKFQDVSVATLGGDVSRTLRLSALSLFKEKSGSLVAGWAGTKKADAKVAQQVEKFAAAVKKSDHVSARKLLDEMPESLRGQWSLQAAVIQLCSSTGDEAVYRAALADGARRFGNAPEARMVLIDHYYFTKNYAAALKSVDGMIEDYGSDGNLQVLRSSLLNESGQRQQAREALVKGCEEEPTLDSLWDACGSLAVADGDYAQAVESFEKLEEVSGQKLDLELLGKTDANFAKFIDSPEAKAWIARKTSSGKKP